MKKTASKKVLTKKIVRLKRKPVSDAIKNNLFVVGIGASAGGLEALKLFFDNASSNSGMAFVVVQHLDPTHRSLLTELIGGHTKMKVSEITDGQPVESDHVYIIPPNKELRINKRILQLTEPVEKCEVRRPIDIFFQSLAEDLKEKAIGIVLSGTGTEGTLGLKMIKAEGGITIVQDPKSAQYAGMPQNAIMANAADFTLLPRCRHNCLNMFKQGYTRS